jgi:hypothetical protein
MRLRRVVMRCNLIIRVSILSTPLPNLLSLNGDSRRQFIIKTRRRGLLRFQTVTKSVAETAIVISNKVYPHKRTNLHQRLRGNISQPLLQGLPSRW